MLDLKKKGILTVTLNQCLDTSFSCLVYRTFVQQTSFLFILQIDIFSHAFEILHVHYLTYLCDSFDVDNRHGRIQFLHSRFCDATSIDVPPCSLKIENFQKFLFYFHRYLHKQSMDVSSFKSILLKCISLFFCNLHGGQEGRLVAEVDCTYLLRSKKIVL